MRIDIWSASAEPDICDRLSVVSAESPEKTKDEASASIERSFKRKLAFSCAPSTGCQQSVTLPVRHRVSPSMASSQVSSCANEVRPPMGAFSDVSVPASVPTHSGSRHAAR